MDGVQLLTNDSAKLLAKLFSGFAPQFNKMNPPLQPILIQPLSDFQYKITGQKQQQLEISKLNEIPPTRDCIVFVAFNKKTNQYGLYKHTFDFNQNNDCFINDTTDFRIVQLDLTFLRQRVNDQKGMFTINLPELRLLKTRNFGDRFNLFIIKHNLHQIQMHSYDECRGGLIINSPQNVIINQQLEGLCLYNHIHNLTINKQITYLKISSFQNNMFQLNINQQINVQNNMGFVWFQKFQKTKPLFQLTLQTPNIINPEQIVLNKDIQCFEFTQMNQFKNFKTSQDNILIFNKCQIDRLIIKDTKYLKLFKSQVRNLIIENCEHIDIDDSEFFIFNAKKYDKMYVQSSKTQYFIKYKQNEEKQSNTYTNIKVDDLINKYHDKQNTLQLDMKVDKFVNTFYDKSMKQQNEKLQLLNTYQKLLQ